MYKTIIVDRASKTKELSAAIERKSNEMADTGAELVTMSITETGKAILVFKVPYTEENTCKEDETSGEVIL